MIFRKAAVSLFFRGDDHLGSRQGARRVSLSERIFLQNRRLDGWIGASNDPPKAFADVASP